MSSKKDKESKNKKRDKPEQKEWEWEDTKLKDSHDTTLLAQDIKQLLITRGEKKQSLKGKKADMIEFLKEKYDVQLTDPIDTLTCKELIVELRLRGLNDQSAKKDILIDRLKGLRDDGAPPPKKQKRGKKAKNGPKVYVAVYTPSTDEENGSNMVLGVYKSEAKAYEKGIERLTEDMEEKWGDQKKKIEKAFEKIDEIDSKNYKKRFDVVGECVNKAFSPNDDDAPYCDIVTSSITQ